MDRSKLRAWVYSKQGLAEKLTDSPRESLLKSGWQRSVGGANPYLAIHARTGASRESIDGTAAELQIFELPSARGCTYILPEDHFRLGLAAGRNFGSNSDLALAKRLGVTDEEIAILREGIGSALKSGALDPQALKLTLGDKVRNLGEEGKKKGLATTLPLAIGQLQSEGVVRRKPQNGRFETQRYDYELWSPALTNLPSDENCALELGRLYFKWIGAASLKDFREFTGFSAKIVKLVSETLGLVEFESQSDLLCLPEANQEYREFQTPHKTQFQLLGSLDSMLLLRPNNAFWLGEEDVTRLVPTFSGMKTLSGMSELPSHAIFDRGRLAGLWEYDSEAGEIAWHSWIPVCEELLESVKSTETFVRDELGDARSLSMDSVASRRPRITALRELQKAGV